MKALAAAALMVGSTALASVGCSDDTPFTANLDGGTNHGGDLGDAASGGAGAGGEGAASGSGGRSGTNQSPDAAITEDAGRPGNGGAPRRFRLAVTGAQLVVTGPDVGLQLTAANVNADADVVSVHQEFYGVPWDAFESNTAPPEPWAAVMNRLAAAARAAGKPVFLSVSPLNGSRQSLAAKTRIENGSVKTTDSWSASCYDFRTAVDRASKRAAFLRYVAYMVEKFDPAYLNVAIEVNLFFEKCPAAAAGVIDVTNAAYDAVKHTNPSTLVFPSFQIDHLYGYSKDSCADASKRSACFDAAYAVIAPIRRDRFAMSTYPYLNGIATAGELPADWFTRGPSRGGETPLIAETGFPSTDIVARAKGDACTTVLSFTEATSAAYLRRVLSDAESEGIDLVTWWSDRDLVVTPLMTDCPCAFDATWCAVLEAFRGPVSAGPDAQFIGELLLKAFGTMGLRHYDGTPKPGHLSPWNAARARPLAP